MARRGENIYHRKDGRWEGRYIKMRNEEGKIKYGYIYGRTYKEVKQQLVKKKALFLNDKKENEPYQGTLNNWLDYWLTTEVSIKRKISTYNSYLSKINCHIRPLLGEILLKDLTLSHLQKLLLELERHLSPASVNAVFRVLKTALKFAEKMDFISSSVYLGCQLPRIEKRKKAVLTENDLKRIAKDVKKSKKDLPIWIALETGLRIGEISALKWTDIDFEAKVLIVQRTMQRVSMNKEKNEKVSELIETTPKTESSRRQVPLSQQLCEYLIDTRKVSSSEYVVSNRGKCVEPRTIRNCFYRLLKRLSIRPFPFHALRHTFATRALNQGINVSVISSLLGHSSTQMTLDVYTCSTEEEERAAVEQLSLNSFFKPSNKPSGNS